MSIISGVIWCGQIKPQRPHSCVCVRTLKAGVLQGARGGARWCGSGLVYFAVALWPHVIRGFCEARCRADPAYSQPLYRALPRDKGRVSQNHSLITTQSFVSIKAWSDGGNEVLLNQSHHIGLFHQNFLFNGNDFEIKHFQLNENAEATYRRCQRGQFVFNCVQLETNCTLN